MQKGPRQMQNGPRATVRGTSGCGMLLQGQLVGGSCALLLLQVVLLLVQIQGGLTLDGVGAAWQAQLTLLQVLGLTVVEEVVQALLQGRHRHQGEVLLSDRGYSRSRGGGDWAAEDTQAIIARCI